MKGNLILPADDYLKIADAAAVLETIAKDLRALYGDESILVRFIPAVEVHSENENDDPTHVVAVYEPGWDALEYGECDFKYPPDKFSEDDPSTYEFMQSVCFTKVVESALNAVISAYTGAAFSKIQTSLSGEQDE